METSSTNNPLHAADVRFNQRLFLLVIASFVIFAASVVMVVGIGATSYDTIDSAGRRMGFNDILHTEHYGIIIRNFHPADLFEFKYIYEWILLTAQVAGGGLLLASARVPGRLVRWFFATQALLFPWGLLGLLFLPSIIGWFVRGQMDREGFVDIPFIWVVSHSTWVITSLFIALAYRDPGLGRSRIWGGLTQRTRGGMRTFVNAIRSRFQKFMQGTTNPNSSRASAVSILKAIK